ncbi:MAG: hypothetical protein JWO22_1924 [Frankiales bacterium]|jgi:hypothetical protein|nr:hypothetical protein [Frankiales bacterium]
MSRSQNQTKTEPFPASATESEAETPASDHPQAPSGTTGARTGDVGDAASVPTTSDQSAPGTSEQAPVVQGLHTPDVEEPDTRS